MVAIQLATEPLVRKTFRNRFRIAPEICVRPTQKGKNSMDESQNIFSMKYLKDKPIETFAGDKFLKLNIAERKKLIEISFTDEVKGKSMHNYTRNDLKSASAQMKSAQSL